MRGSRASSDDVSRTKDDVSRTKDDVSRTKVLRYGPAHSKWARDLLLKEPIVYTYRLRQAVQPTPKSGSFKSAEKVPDTSTVRLAQA